MLTAVSSKFIKSRVVQKCGVGGFWCSWSRKNDHRLHLWAVANTAQSNNTHWLAIYSLTWQALHQNR